METNNNQPQKKPLTKKGLGWVPDYPDLRDYNLEKEEEIKSKLRFKTEGKTRDIEKIIEGIISLISDTSVCSQEERINDLKRKIFGNIGFAKVKVHKLLIKHSNKDDTNSIDKKYPPNEVTYESILSKQITELKTYLAFLQMRGYLDTNLTKFNEPQAVVEWIRNSEYDDDTKLLVKEFQERSKILADGIVGLETYITFNDYFAKKRPLSELKENNKAYKKGLSRIKFFAVTSLLSRGQFETILEIFQSKVTDQISKELETNQISKKSYNSNSKNYDNITVFEYVFLEKIGLEETLFEESFGKANVADLENIKKYINLNYNEKNNSIPKYEDVVRFLQNSSVTEPIISVILHILSPLAQWSNLTWEEMITEGLRKFEDIANNKQQSDSSDKSNKEPGYSDKKLVKNAIFQTLSLIKLELYSIQENKGNKKDKINTAILVFFLLKKYLNRFKNYILDAEKEIKEESKNNIKEIKEESKNNIFDKKEVFEIERLCNDESTPATSKQNQTTKVKELFSSLDLYIPVVMSDLYLKELSGLKQEDPSEQLYFQLPTVVDLSFWCSPVRDQGSLNSCTAFAAIALLEYFENRNFGQTKDASPLFLYKAARNKMKVTGDVGASIRETMKALALFGVPPEQSWPYEEEKFDEEPSPYCYAYAQNYKSLKYFLLDYAGITTETLLFQVKAVLAAGFPCIFGLTLYSSVYEQSNYKKGYIPYPDANQDKVVGGHTAVVVGYDDFKFIRCANRKNYSRGAFLVRNSWGTEWGVNGYGWLPYDYVLAGLTSAWWSLLKAEWFDESNFGPARQGGVVSGTGDSGDDSGSNSGSQGNAQSKPGGRG